MSYRNFNQKELHRAFMNNSPQFGEDGKGKTSRSSKAAIRHQGTWRGPDRNSHSPSTTNTYV